jgi:isocitrate/isopropylmalate dehydrogenase
VTNAVVVGVLVMGFAVAATLTDPATRTGDLGGTADTGQVAMALIDQIRRPSDV